MLGGTAWTFTNTKRVERGALDLLIIDEAGQFSLANTIAVSVAARRLLLLGDPQQLPQVSQGTHPEPVATSALEWIADGNDTMPPDRGFFLERTWRMHSRLTAVDSRLSYSGRLESERDVTDARASERRRTWAPRDPRRSQRSRRLLTRGGSGGRPHRRVSAGRDMAGVEGRRNRDR